VGRVFSGARVSPLRVCIDARLPAGRFGGVEQVLIGIAAGLSKLGDGDEEFLFLSHRGEDDWIRPYVSGPCRLLPTRRSTLNRRARAITRGLAERAPRIGTRFAVRVSDGIAERSDADLIHFPIQDAFLTELPSIYQPHDLQHLHHPEFFSRWELERRERIYRTHCARARMVVAMTSWGKRDLLSSYGLPEEKVRVVPWGSVLWEYPEPSPADLDRLRETLSLPDQFLLFPAQTWPHKNHETLLEALALIRDREQIAIPLVCPGKRTRHFAHLDERMRELELSDTTLFPGFVSPTELRGLYELATALVFPSRFEGWGLPVCEAFSAGLPVASSSATGLPDLVGDAGLLFDPDDAEQIADRVLLLWRDAELRRTLASRGVERGAMFDFDRTARLFRAHYRRLANRPLSEEDRGLLAAPPLA
jgi:glycosyltransferase involved in cell wall biosynthesis